MEPVGLEMVQLLHNVIKFYRDERIKLDKKVLP